jgi:hypothetical protein
MNYTSRLFHPALSYPSFKDLPQFIYLVGYFKVLTKLVPDSGDKGYKEDLK